MRGSFPLALRSNMSGFVWFFLQKKGLALSFLCWHRSQRFCMPETMLHLLHFHLMTDNLCVCVCKCVHVCFSGILMFVWSVWYVNAMLMHRTNQPSATWRRGWRLSVSHVTSSRACQICQSSSDAKPLTHVEKFIRIQLSFFLLFFFLSSWGFCFLWKPRSPWQRLPDPVQEALPARRITHLCLLPRLWAHWRGCN